ncbi:MAG: hypothetical protein HY906_03445 [Deltaproteobacteria bacterium]|nr:hypothetical protein [Deltaproteobacteria bacterium]
MAYGKQLIKVLRHPVRFVSVLRTVLTWLEIYFTTQNETDEDAAEVIETEADDRIAPDGQAIYPYLFACVYILFVAWYLMDKVSVGEYRKAREAFLKMIHEARAAFRAKPSRMRDRSRLDHPLVRFTQTVDGPTNCFPSLHVALVTLSYQIIKQHAPDDALLLSAMRESCIEICRSTMRTKQHSIIDVIGGIELARRAVDAHFGGAFEDLTTVTLPELTPDEVAQIRAIVSGRPDLPELGRELLRLFGVKRGAPGARTRG